MAELNVAARDARPRASGWLCALVLLGTLSTTTCSGSSAGPGGGDSSASSSSGSTTTQCQPTCDDGNPCTDDTCANGACTHDPTKVGAKCEGGVACDGSGVCTGGSLNWAKLFGDTGTQTAYASAVDPAGNVLLAATNDSVIDFGGGPLQAAGQEETVLAKLDKDGNYVWGKRLPAAPTANGSFVIATDVASNVLLGSRIQDVVDVGGGPLGTVGAHHLLFAKFSASGDHLWSKIFGAPTDSPWLSGLATDAAGDLVIQGAYSKPIDFGGGPLPAPGGRFLAKLDANGAHVWSKAFEAFPIGGGLAIGPAGDIVLAGSFSGLLDLGGPMLAAGAAGSLFLARFDPAGNHVWSKAFNCNVNGPWPQPLAYTADRIVWAGSMASDVDLGGGTLANAGADDVFLASFDLAGKHIWSKRFGGTQGEFAGSIATESSGDIVLTALSPGTAVDFGGGPVGGGAASDSFVAKLSKDGTHLWSKGFASTGDGGFLPVGVQPSGKIVVTGAFSGSPDFGAGPVACKGEDAAVASFGP